jgi:hypothetical protein
LGTLVLVAPWLFHVYGGTLFNFFGQQITTPAQSLSVSTQQYNTIGDITFYLPAWMWFLLPIIIAWGLWQRRRGIAIIGLWWFFIFLAANPSWLKLPGTGTLSNFAVFIAAYIPASLIIGVFIGWFSDYLKDLTFSKSRIMHSIVFGLIIIVSIWGALQRLTDMRINEHALVTRPDVRASAWIRDQTPQHSGFLVNSFFAYDGTLMVGSDGGLWLPLLANRKTTLPPIVYGFEEGINTNYLNWTNDLLIEVQNKSITHPDVINLLRERGISNVYIGQRRGRVNYSGPFVLDPKQLIEDNHYQPIYNQDMVWIFNLLP